MWWWIIIAAIPLIIAAFFIGRLFASKPIENNNQKIKEEYYELIKLKQEQEAERRQTLDDLDSKINWKWQELTIKEEQLKSINNQYQDKLKVIENTEELAQKAYDAKSKEYQQKLQEEEKQYKDLLNIHMQEIENLKQELESIKATKAAAIEAAHKEQEISDNKEEYCLILPREEERDIPILRETQYKISKPRTIAMAIWNGYYQPLAKTKFPRILGKQDVCGIYKITNQKTGECYVGQALDVRKRWYEHTKCMIGIDTPQNNLLYAAAQKYGLDDFTFEILLECKQSELDAKEKYFIELYNSNVFGYNRTGGNK